jgi:predicted GIY-YIG superfamily endonuclease
VWPWNASTQGHLYIFHFNAPLGNLANTRAQASHYCGFAEDLDARIAKQLAGRGAKLVAAALKQGLIFELYHWPACLATEKLVKRTKKTALYCPACCATAHRKVRPLPTPPVIEQLAFDLVEAEELPVIELGRMDWLEIKIQQEWRLRRIPVPAGIDDDLL